MKFGGPQRHFHHWFAWHPVWLEDSREFAWWETVWRRVIHRYYNHGGTLRSYYRERPYDDFKEGPIARKIIADAERHKANGRPAPTADAPQ